MVVAAKAQRVGGVRRIAAKTAVARVGGLKAPVSLHMRKGTRPSRARDAFPTFSRNVVTIAGGGANAAPGRLRALPARTTRLRKPQTLGLPAPVVAHFL